MSLIKVFWNNEFIEVDTFNFDKHTIRCRFYTFLSFKFIWSLNFLVNEKAFVGTLGM